MLKIRNQKGFASILALLIVVAIIGYFSYKSLVQEGDNPQTEGYKQQIEKAEEIAKFAKERAGEINKELGEYVEKEQNKIKISLKISANGSENEYSKRIEKESSVFDLMKLIDDENNNFSFKYKESSMGVFIEEINEIKNNASDNMYWMFYVNNKLSEVGASGYKLSEGDSVEWKYEDTSGTW